MHVLAQAAFGDVCCEAVTVSAQWSEESEELPPPSPELVLMRVFVAAYIATAHERPKRRGRAFLRRAVRLLEQEDSIALLSPIRPSSQHVAVAKARRGAVSMFREYRPFFLAMLPPE
jgi:hypothetical protein